MRFRDRNELNVVRTAPGLRRRVRDLFTHVCKILSNRGHTKL